MKLYLSSFDIGNFPEKLKSLFSRDRGHIGIVMNALDHKPIPRSEWLDRNTKNLRDLGYTVEEIDLRIFFDNSITQDYLSRFDGLWVNGGNVFILQRSFSQSGLNDVLPAMIEKEKIVYAGFSAALYVISPTLRGADLVDNPNVVPKEYLPEFSWSGLSILNTSIAVHYKSNHSESEAIDKEIEYYKVNNLPYEVLRDGEVYFENGESKEFLRI